jgi:hypothetical protein
MTLGVLRKTTRHDLADSSLGFGETVALAERWLNWISTVTIP